MRVLRGSVNPNVESEVVVMPKITGTKIGLIRLREFVSGRWKVDFFDPEAKRRIRRVLPASSFRQARKQAETINISVSSKHGFGGAGLRGRMGEHSVCDAILEGVRHSQGRERTLKNYLSLSNSFTNYLQTKTTIEYWGDILESTISNFIEHLRHSEIADETIISRLFVVRMVSGYMARTYPAQYRDVAGGIKFRRQDVPKAELERGESILSPVQLRALLGWLNTPQFDESLRARRERRLVCCWATVQALCGLRVFEIGYLREMDFNRENQTLRVTKNEAHSPKTKASYREIPIPSQAAAVLEKWIDDLKLRHDKQFLFFPERAIKGRVDGKSPAARCGVLTQDAISHIWGRVLARIRASRQLDIPAKFTARKLRATFITCLRAAKVDYETLQKYVGHSPGSVLSANYDRIGADRLREIADLASDLGKGAGMFQNQEKAAIKNTLFGH